MRPVDYSLIVEKQCSKCREVKPVSEYNRYDDPKQPINGWRYYSQCRECSREGSRQYGADDRSRRNDRLRNWRRVNPESAKAKDRRARLMAKYGLTEAEASWLLDRFDGACWLCLKVQAKAIDHDHSSGVVRGALCNRCNTVVMALVDADPEFIDRLAAYAESGRLPTQADGEVSA